MPPDVPIVPVRSSGWQARRVPRLGYAALAAVIAGAVLVGLTHRPNTDERAADLRGFVADMRADIGSCAGDVAASLAALRKAQAGTSRQVAAARLVATSGASDCSPANDVLIDDLIQYQVTESLASYQLSRAVNGLVAWAAPDAVRAQADVARVLAARGTPAQASAQAALRTALRIMDAQRAAVDRVIGAASRSLAARVRAPALPG